MDRSIIVALDDKPMASQVLLWALGFADATDRITVVSVWNAVLIGGMENPFANLNDGQIHAAERANRIVDQVVQSRWNDHLPNVPIEVDVRHGDPVTELLRASDGADLLVLGHNRRSGLSGFGSVADELTAKANCAVVLVPPNAARAAPSRTAAGRSA